MKLLTLAGLLTMAFLSAGCCFFIEPPPLPPPNDAKVVVKSSSMVNIEDVSVRQEEAVLVIKGTLHPVSFFQKKAGHVDVRIVDAAGHLLRELKVSPDEAVFLKENNRVSSFLASVNLTVSPDARVCLRAHAGPAERCTRIR